MARRSRPVVTGGPAGFRLAEGAERGQDGWMRDGTGRVAFGWVLLWILAVLAGCGKEVVIPMPAPQTSAPPVALVGEASTHGAAVVDEADPRSLAQLGDAAMQSGKLPEALALFERSLKLQPDDEEAHFNAGFLCAQLGRTDEAIFHYQEAVRVLPEYGEAHNNLGNLFRRVGRTADAVRHFELALQHSPSSHSAHNNLGTALAMEGRVAEAIPHFVAATDANPGYAEAWMNLGNAYVQVGRVEESIRVFRKALEANPQLEGARRGLARAQARLAAGGRPPAP